MATPLNDENQAIVIIDNDTGRLSAGIAPPVDEERLHIDLDYAITQWLAAKLAKSGSKRTRDEYREVLGEYRAALQFKSLDLDSVERAATRNAQLLAKTMLKDIAHRYANFRKPEAKKDQAIAPATRNTRYAIISSFYRFCIRQEWMTYNPIEHIERSKVQAYAGAHALDSEEVSERMQAIDRETQAGKRDYALLAIYLYTGRRLSEVAGLRWQHVRLLQRGRVVSLEFHVKGGEVYHNELPPGVSKALLAWLHDFYGPSLAQLAKDAPLFVSLARGCNRITKQPSYGEALGIQAIADICLKHLGVSKVHTTRHTYTAGMLEAEASVEEIRRGLGHKSLATTGRYTDSISQLKNRRAEKLAELFGIK